MYRIGANNIGLGVAGAVVLDISTTGLAITGTLSATGGITATNVATQANQETHALPRRRIDRRDHFRFSQE